MGLRRGARSRRAVLTAAVLAASLTGSLTAGCAPRGPNDDRAPRHTRAVPAPPPAPTPSAGAGAAGSPLAVKIDNVRAARPQTGLEAADVVYAEEVEGGLSRLMAVYATRLPAAVGPVRSVRESDLELLRQFDRPTLAFSGAQRKLLPLIRSAPLRAQSPAGAPAAAYYRGRTRPAPHNLYLHPGSLLPAVPGESALTTGFRYGPAPRSGGVPTAARTVRYPAARFTFTWSAGLGRWLVAMDGTPAPAADGSPLGPATVVVQYVRIRPSRYHDVLGNPSPYTETVGAGRAEVLRGGLSFDATWSRPVATGGTTFTGADGRRLAFAPGQVWVVFAPAP